MMNKEEIGNKEHNNYKYQIEVWLKSYQQTKVQGQMASQANSIKHLEKVNTPSFSNFQKLQRK